MSEAMPNIGHNITYLSIYRNIFAIRIGIRLYAAPQGRHAWISICPNGRSSGENGFRPSSTRKCCRAIAPGSNIPRPAARPRPSWPSCSSKARAAGLWNLGLPELAADEPGTRLSNLEYAPLAEIMGRLFWASEVFNCQAPDVPNMIALQNCATPEQKAALAAAAARSRDPFGLRDDRTRCGLLGRDQYRDHDRARSATTTSSTGANGSSPAPRIRAAVS